MADPLELPEPIDIKTAKPVDKKYGPFATVAAAKLATAGYRYDGMTVKILGTSSEYWWEASDLSDAGIKAKFPPAVSFPKIKYVYLVNDAADQTAMGGISAGVFIIAQDAYNAALAIIINNPGFSSVLILVGNTDAATVGGVVLNATSGGFHTQIKWQGISQKVSAIGNIDGSLKATYTLLFKNLTVGTLNNSSGGGNFTITAEDTTCGIISYYGSGQSLNLSACLNLTSGDITLNGVSTNAATLVSTNSKGLYLGNITTTNNAHVNVSGISATAGAALTSIKSINLGAGSTRGCNVTLTNVEVLANITYACIAAFPKAVAMVNTKIAGTTSISMSGNTSSFAATNCLFIGSMDFTGSVTNSSVFRSCTAGKIIALPANTICQGAHFYDAAAATPVINGIGAGCEFYCCSIIGGSFAIDNSSAVTVKFTGGISAFKSAMGANITLN